MKKIILGLLLCFKSLLVGSNQTSDISTVLVNQPLPFNVSIELADFSLPLGIQSGASAQLGANYLLLAGRTNGLHGFDSIGNDFPPSQQNSTVIVVNVQTQTVYTRSLQDAGLTQAQVDTLSVTSPQYYQSGNTLYMTGGYGIDTASGEFSTKDTLTAINVPGLIDWVVNPQSGQLATSYIRQISNPVFEVTGGFMCQFGDEPTLLIFGQNFIGTYTASSNGIYTKQVRRFNIIDDGQNLGVIVLPATGQQEAYRRRDLNVVPIIKTVKHKHKDKQVPAWVALSGVFTPASGIWTVPVDIASNGATMMANPQLASTFKQGMNNYACAHLAVSGPNGDSYALLFGGLTFEYYLNGSFETDAQIPFTNNVTAVRRSKDGLYQQYLLPCEYPTILSTFSNAGSTLLFGAGAVCMIAPNMPVYSNNVLNLAKLKTPAVVGYIIGGIASTLPNTVSRADSTASPYIFKLVLTPK